MNWLQRLFGRRPAPLSRPMLPSGRYDLNLRLVARYGEESEPVIVRRLKAVLEVGSDGSLSIERGPITFTARSECWLHLYADLGSVITGRETWRQAHLGSMQGLHGADGGFLLPAGTEITIPRLVATI